MSEHTDARTPDHGPRRELTEEEAKFIGADEGTEHQAPPRTRHEGHAGHEHHDHHEGHEHHAHHEGREHHEAHGHDAVAERAEIREPHEHHEAGGRAEVRERADTREHHADPDHHAGPEHHADPERHAEHGHGEPAPRGDALFPTDEAESLRTRWDGIQTEFVDEPRAAVEKADALVGDVMQRLADGFSAERGRLEREWDRGDSVSTEDLRVALKRYRSFFDRLLSI